MIRSESGGSTKGKAKATAVALAESKLGKDIGKGRWFHGTGRDLKPGDTLRNDKGRIQGTSATAHYDFAKKYANRANFVLPSMKTAENIKPRVFEVGRTGPGAYMNRTPGRYLDPSKPRSEINPPDNQGFRIKKQVSPFGAKAPTAVAKLGALAYIPALMQAGSIMAGKTGGKPKSKAQ